MMSKVPILETPRLILRQHGVDDFPDMVSLWTEPEVTRFTSGNKPSTPEECWQRLLRYRGLWSLLGFGYFVITERRTGTYVGEAGLADFHRSIMPSMSGKAEAGWALMPSDWGKGYANEALNAIFNWYEGTPNPRALSCIINPDNAASIRLAEKTGFRLKKETQYNGSACLMFER
jgi:RimJ/RimL family protein N-acetyltransferase